MSESFGALLLQSMAENGPAWLFATALLIFAFGFVFRVFSQGGREKKLLMAQVDNLQAASSNQYQAFSDVLQGALQIERDRSKELLDEQRAAFAEERHEDREHFDARLKAWETRSLRDEAKVDDSQNRFLAHLQERSEAETESRNAIAHALMQLSQHLDKDTQTIQEISQVQSASHRTTHDMLIELRHLVTELKDGPNKKRQEAILEAIHTLTANIERYTQIVEAAGPPAR